MMGLRYIDSRGEGEPGCVMFCSTTNWAFGPVFEDAGAAWAFEEWLGLAALGTDARILDEAELKDAYETWYTLYHAGLAGLDRLAPGRWLRDRGIDHAEIQRRRERVKRHMRLESIAS